MIGDIWQAFLLGLATPLLAVCVLPLYPGFLAYLSNRVKDAGKHMPVILSLIVTAGVITFMLALGLVFTTLLEVSLTNVIGIVSPIAFGLMGLISLVLIFDIDFSKIFPHFNAPQAKNPYGEAYLFGFFFGAIVIPCNPAFIAILFTKSLLTTSFASNILQFLAFGIGIGAPLVVLSALSSGSSKGIIRFLTTYKRWINLITGLLMLGISLYYLLFVFKIFGG